MVSGLNVAHQGDTLTSRPIALPADQPAHLQFQSYLNNPTSQPCVEVSEDGKVLEEDGHWPVNNNWGNQEVDLSPCRVRPCSSASMTRGRFGKVIPDCT